MKPTESEQRKALLQAIRETWQARSDEVREFGLQTLENEIAHEHAGWTVPIVSTIPTGSALRLADVLRILQDSIETKSKLWITLYLDPFADTTMNGDN